MNRLSLNAKLWLALLVTWLGLVFLGSWAALPWLALRTYYRNEITLTRDITGEKQRIAIRPRVSTDNLYALRSAAMRGMGVCVGSAWMLAEAIADGRLVQLVPAVLSA